MYRTLYDKHYSFDIESIRSHDLNIDDNSNKSKVMTLDCISYNIQLHNFNTYEYIKLSDLYEVHYQYNLVSLYKSLPYRLHKEQEAFEYFGLIPNITTVITNDDGFKTFTKYMELILR